MASSLSTMGFERFELLCNELGYPPNKVRSIRFNPIKVTVVFDDEFDRPTIQVHKVVH
jgi:hypothetical protein